MSTIKAAAADWVARRDAGLSRAEAAELQAWLAADSRHRDALAQCDSTWGALDRPYKAGAADDLLRAIEQRVRQHRRRRVAAFAAGLAVLLIAGVVWRANINPAAEPLESTRAGTAVVVVPQQRTLPDGSVAELNSGAEMAVDFSGRLRRVVLHKGEAHFQVVSDGSRPFVVVVGDIEVRVVGTAFSVQRAEKRVEVLVTQGEVAVDKHKPPRSEASAPDTNDAAAAPETLATLVAGYRAVVDFSTTNQARPDVAITPAGDASERLAWRAPRLEFSGTPLAKAVALLNEQADKAAAAGQPVRRYTIGDPEIGAMRVSGLFRVDNTDAFVRLLQHGFGIEAEKRDGSDEIVLRNAR